jgi:hypothetical protein
MDGQEQRRAIGLEIVPVWKAISPELTRELVDMWGSTRAIASPSTAQLRSSQAVCIGRDDDGAIRAVATAVVQVLPRLREPMYYYRQYFDPALRGQGQTTRFFNRARQVLASYNETLPTPESIGVLVELENPWLAAHYARARIDEADSIFIGYSPRGLQMRVSYFEGARLTAVAPLARPRQQVR